MTLLMIRPAGFAFNPQTAVNNAFQKKGAQPIDIHEQALRQFDQMVDVLRDHDIDVLVVQDTLTPHTPDSVFPNNWISFHEEGTVVYYPMFALNRRLERKPSVLEALKKRFHWKKEIDFADSAEQGLFLEGTGSMVLDRIHRIAYACQSARTDESLLQAFCEAMGYQYVLFEARGEDGSLIYHTNVMMCVAEGYAVICLESIQEKDKARVVAQLEKNGHRIVPITLQQMNHFAGNMLQVFNRAGQAYLVMSTAAFQSLDSGTRDLLLTFNPILHSDLSVIETFGGGSARCMMAEIPLPAKTLIA